MSYDLEKRTLDFAIATGDLFKQMKHGVSNVVYIKQLIRSGSSG